MLSHTDIVATVSECRVVLGGDQSALAGQHYSEGRVGGYQAYRRYGALELLGVMNLKPGRAGTRIHLRIHMVSRQTIRNGAGRRQSAFMRCIRDVP